MSAKRARAELAGARLEAESARLVRRYRLGDAQAVDRLCALWAPVLRRHFGSALGDHYAADDATQQVLLQMVRALPRYRRYAQVPFGSWVYRIARRQLLRHMRDSGPVEPMAPDVVAALRDQVEGSSASSGRWLEDDRVAAAYEGLPDAQRRVLMLKFGFGLQSAEIATALGLSAGNVRQLQRRALNAIERDCAPPADRRQPLSMSRREDALPVLHRRQRALGQHFGAM